MSLPPEPQRVLSVPAAGRSGSVSSCAQQALLNAQQAWLEGRPSVPGFLQQAQEADPQWAYPLVLQALWCLGQAEADSPARARAWLNQAAACLPGAPPHELQHAHAAVAVLDGRWHEACRLWDDLLLGSPHDVLALLLAHHWDVQRGEALRLRQRPAAVLPDWDETDPSFAQVMGLYAAGLSENQLYPQAEDMGRRALALQARVPAAVVAVAQVMQSQGRFEDGTAWLRQHQPAWAEDAVQASHGWWLMGLFRLEAMDVPGLQRLVDAHLSGAALGSAQARIDAVSLLWRMQCVGVDVGGRFAEVLQVSPPDAPDVAAGEHARSDLHVLLALLGAGELARAERWVARCAERALQPEEARRSNHAVARELGLPLMRSVLALSRGEGPRALASLHAMRNSGHRLGGTAVRREWLDHTLLSAACEVGAADIGRALLNERRMSRPLTPLTRHWAARLGLAL